MERQAKLDIVIKAIEEAKGITPKGQLVKVYLSNVLKHNRLRLQELQNILTILEDDEKILTLMSFPRYLLNLDLASYTYHTFTAGESSWKKVDPSKEYFTVKVRRTFNEWCANYWADKDSIDIMTREKAESLVLDAMKKEAISQQDLDTLSQYANDDPDGFLDVVQKIGKNPFMDALMKRLIPELTPEDLEDILNPQPLSPADSLVRRRKASWVKTNVPWDIKKLIWQLWAKGDSVVATQRFFELHQGEYEGAPFDKKTIAKVREELGGLSNELASTLVAELPEVRSLIQEQKSRLVE